jgi:hypothetical protein
MNLREIENIIRDSFAVLGTREAYLGPVIETLTVPGIRCLISSKYRAVIIPDLTNDSFIKVKFGGIKVETIELGSEYGFDTPTRYTALWCIKHRLREIFNRIIADLLFDLDEHNVVSQITNRLDGWKLLLSGYESKNEEKGLWGELYFLRFLLESNNGNIRSWSGPEGATKDFEFDRKRAEVKTTAVRAGWLAEMNGIYQTDLIPGCRDYLIFNRVEAVRQNGITISDLLNDIRQNTDFAGKALLDQKISNFSYEVVSSTDQWNILETRIFEINNEFPVIGRESFRSNTLPRGVLTLSYTIDLSGFLSHNLNEWTVLP